MNQRSKRRALGAAIGAAVLGAGFWWSLPQPLFDDEASTILLARDGTLLGASIAPDEQWRFPPTSDVPEKFAAAIIAFEDRRFERHPGVDPLAVARAAASSLRHGRVTSGASTLTMQVLRLARGNPRRTVQEKLIEMVLALRLEMSTTKSEILGLYASHAPFGGNVVGLSAASWRYFGRPPETLSWAEAATLAVLPNSPALIHPGRARTQLRDKRDRLLARLHANGRLSELELELARREPLPDRPHPMPRLAPHLLDTLRSAKARSGHRLETTIDARLQRSSADVVSEHAARLSERGIHNAAALIVDNRSFEVRAYIGNSAWTSSGERGHAVDLVPRPRSSGSILKPLLYAAMLESGDILPRTLVPDVPTQYQGYMPENFDRTYRGAVPADVALARSLNVPAVRMLQRYGAGRFHDFLTHFGFSTLDRPASDYGLTLILGGAETSLWDTASAYANLSHLAGGDRTGTAVYRDLTLLSDGPVESPRRAAEIGPASAWLTLDALVEVQRPGNERYWKAFGSSRKVGWKTGTSFGLRDAWAVGTTPAFTVAVWVGNASGEGRPGLTGAAVAAPLLFDLFNLLDDPEDEWFNEPFLDMKRVRVCRADGYLIGGGCEFESEWVPRASHFDRVTPFHRRVHLDPSSGLRVHGGCESPASMDHRSWFVLPATMEFFYRRHQAGYRSLPRFRSDCHADARALDDEPLAFLYPEAGTKLYIPVDLSSKRGRTVFEAVHRDPDATLFWHLDERFIGRTTAFHQQALDLSPGEHTVTVVDERGRRVSHSFEVLSAESTPHQPTPAPTP